MGLVTNEGYNDIRPEGRTGDRRYDTVQDTTQLQETAYSAAPLDNNARMFIRHEPHCLPEVGRAVWRTDRRSGGRAVGVGKEGQRWRSDNGDDGRSGGRRNGGCHSTGEIRTVSIHNQMTGDG